MNKSSYIQPSVHVTQLDATSCIMQGSPFDSTYNDPTEEIDANNSLVHGRMSLAPAELEEIINNVNSDNWNNGLW